MNGTYLTTWDCSTTWDWLLLGLSSTSSIRKPSAYAVLSDYLRKIKLVLDRPRQSHPIQAAANTLRSETGTPWDCRAPARYASHQPTPYSQTTSAGSSWCLISPGEEQTKFYTISFK